MQFIHLNTKIPILMQGERPVLEEKNVNSMTKFHIFNSNPQGHSYKIKQRGLNAY